MKPVHFLHTLFIACVLGMFSPSTSLAGHEPPSQATEKPVPQEEHTPQEAHPAEYPNLNERDGYDSKTHQKRYRRIKTKSQKKALRQSGLRHNL